MGYSIEEDINQQQINDDEFAELLSGGSGSNEFVQPKWNIDNQNNPNNSSNLRET